MRVQELEAELSLVRIGRGGVCVSPSSAGASEEGSGTDSDLLL